MKKLKIKKKLRMYLLEALLQTLCEVESDGDSGVQLAARCIRGHVDCCDICKPNAKCSSGKPIALLVLEKKKRMFKTLKQEKIQEKNPSREKKKRVFKIDPIDFSFWGRQKVHFLFVKKKKLEEGHARE